MRLSLSFLLNWLKYAFCNHKLYTCKCIFSPYLTSPEFRKILLSIPIFVEIKLFYCLVAVCLPLQKDIIRNISTKAFLACNNKTMLIWSVITESFRELRLIYLEQIIVKSSCGMNFPNLTEMRRSIIFPRTRKPEYFGIINKCHPN